QPSPRGARKTSAAGDAGPVRNVIGLVGLTGRFLLGVRVQVICKTPSGYARVVGAVTPGALGGFAADHGFAAA
ncbi:MAG: hypothetical protein ACC645_21885, partial [Pirellulales bacterium]